MQAQLASYQRQHLIDLLERRLRKLSDAALLELERLTRYPEELSHFSPVRVVSPGSGGRGRGAVSLVTRGGGGGQSLTRREFFAYAGGGGLALLTLLSGYGWLRARSDLERQREVLDEFERVVLGAVLDVGARVEKVRSVVGEVYRGVEGAKPVLLSYRESFLLTQQSVFQLEEVCSRLRGLCDDLAGTGFDIPTLVQEMVGLVGLLPSVERYVRPVDLMMEIVKEAPRVAEVLESAVGYLRGWFGGGAGEGVDVRLLEPLSEAVFVRVEECREEVERLREVWEREMVARVEQVVRRRG